MGMATNASWSTNSASSVGGNSQVYDEKGRRIALQDSWRIPQRPFAKPTCGLCDSPTKRIGFGMYRCTSCAARIWPERLYHRLWKGEWRRIFRVVRWRPVE